MDLRNRPRRFELRARTTDMHAELDALVGEWRSLEDYRAYLAAMAAFRSVAEPMLQSWPAEQADGWMPTLTLAALNDDAADLGIAVDSAEAADVSLPGDALIGAAYVLEGASLGAKVLARRAAALGLDQRNGARHLAAQAGATENWRHFLAMLESRQPFDMDAAVRGATVMFGLAQASFGRAKHARPAG